MKNYFSDREFQNRRFPKNPSPAENFLLKNLRDKILNPIRAEIGGPVRLTDCYRTLAKYKAMKKGGKYNPSATSDHFWGQPIPTVRPRDRKKYGKIYPYSVGAVDFYIPWENMDDVFTFVMDMEKELKIRTGQIILEWNPRTDFQWIHISNPKEIVFSDALINDMGLARLKYLKSDNNGRSYRQV